MHVPGRNSQQKCVLVLMFDLLNITKRGGRGTRGTTMKEKSELGNVIDVEKTTTSQSSPNLTWRRSCSRRGRDWPEEQKDVFVLPPCSCQNRCCPILSDCSSILQGWALLLQYPIFIVLVREFSWRFTITFRLFDHTE